VVNWKEIGMAKMAGKHLWSVAIEHSRRGDVVSESLMIVTDDRSFRDAEAKARHLIKRRKLVRPRLMEIGNAGVIDA
jgi:hypothetical protein